METKLENEQLLTLCNRAKLSVSGTNKIISLKTDLIQLSTVLGDLQISGNKLELLKLDNSHAEILGEINSLKFLETKSKQSVFRKIFK